MFLVGTTAFAAANVLICVYQSVYADVLATDH